LCLSINYALGTPHSYPLGGPGNATPITPGKHRRKTKRHYRYGNIPTAAPLIFDSPLNSRESFLSPYRFPEKIGEADFYGASTNRNYIRILRIVPNAAKLPPVARQPKPYPVIKKPSFFHGKHYLTRKILPLVLQYITILGEVLIRKKFFFFCSYCYS